MTQGYELRDKKVLIIGATGFIGSHLTSALCKLGAQVTCVSRNIDSFHSAGHIGTNWQKCDASDRRQIGAIINNIRPQIIYNLSSDSKGGRDINLIPGSIQNDVMSTINVLLESAHIDGIHVVIAGSVEEPSSSDAFPSRPYAAAKATSTAYARMISDISGLRVSILRLMMVYGPGQKSYKVLPYVITQLLKGQTAEVGRGFRKLDWVYINDVVEAFLRIACRPWLGSQPIDIGTGSLLRLRDCIETIGELTGRSDLIVFGSTEHRMSEREEAADVEPAMLKLNWKAQTNFRDGIQMTIESFRSGIC